MTGGTHDDGSYLTDEGPNKDRESEQPAYHIHKARQEADQTFTFENFAGTGYKATLTYDVNGEPVLKLDGGSNKLPLVAVPGMGYTAGVATDSLTDDEEAFLNKLRTLIFRTDIQQDTVDTVMAYDRNGNNGKEIQANGGGNFKLAERTWTYREKKDFIGIDWLAKDALHPRYQYGSITMYGYTMTMEYTTLIPTDASLSMEYYATGKMYEITVDGETVTVYENEADGAWYTSKEFKPEDKLEFRDEMTLDDYKYTVTQNGADLEITIGDKKVTVTYYGKNQISGSNRYTLDGIVNILAEVNGDNVRLVTEEKIYEKIEESGQKYSYETGKIILENNSGTYYVNPVDAPAEGETVVSSENNVTIVIDSEGNYKIKTVTTDEEGKETTSYTDLTKRKEVVETNYAMLTQSGTAVDKEGNEREAQWQFCLKENDQIVNLYYLVGSNDGALYYRVGNEFVAYGKNYSSDGNGGFYFSETSYNTYGGYENLNKRTEEIMVSTGTEVLTYANDATFHGGTITRGKNSTARFEANSYVTNANLSGGSLVLRPGSSNPGGSSTLTIDGPIAKEKPIPIKAVSIRENSQTGATNGYRITDSLYLTQSGLAVNLVIKNGQVTFASKFDGTDYNSDWITAKNFGSLGQNRELIYDINGKIQYNRNLYLRMRFSTVRWSGWSG